RIDSDREGVAVVEGNRHVGLSPAELSPQIAHLQDDIARKAEIYIVHLYFDLLLLRWRSGFGARKPRRYGNKDEYSEGLHVCLPLSSARSVPCYFREETYQEVTSAARAVAGSRKRPRLECGKSDAIRTCYTRPNGR